MDYFYLILFFLFAFILGSAFNHYFEDITEYPKWNEGSWQCTELGFFSESDADYNFMTCIEEQKIRTRKFYGC